MGSGDAIHHGSNETPVDATLAQALNVVEHAVAAYLADSASPERDALHAAIQAIDVLSARSDAYENSLVNSPIWGFSGKGAVLGETSAHPLVELVPATELAAQAALVKAARAELAAPTLTNLQALADAASALEQLRLAPTRARGDDAVAMD
jgi:hypothetical protein